MNLKPSTEHTTRPTPNPYSVSVFTFLKKEFPEMPDDWLLNLPYPFSKNVFLGIGFCRWIHFHIHIHISVYILRFLQIEITVVVLFILSLTLH